MQDNQEQVEQIAAPAPVEEVKPKIEEAPKEAAQEESTTREESSEGETAKEEQTQEEAPKEETVKEEAAQEEVAKEEATQAEASAEPVLSEQDQKHDNAIKEAIALFDELSPLDKWEFYGDTNGIMAYTRLDQATGLKMARGNGVINKPVDVIVKPVLESESVKKWAGNLQSHQVVEDAEFIVYRSIDVKRMFVTQRETVVATKIIKREDGSTLVVQRSTEHPNFPETTDYVRAQVLLFAWLFTPDQEDANKTKVTSIIFVDPKGWVPIPVFNAFIHDQAQSVKKLKDFTEKL